jgi:molybdopterin-biosynthesis enzyme MoeA-like protein
MADIPVGATLIDNPVSAAPGFQLKNVYVMAGVPSIMQSMFEGVSVSLKGGITGDTSKWQIQLQRYV